jgi:hypothetical protein
MNWIVQIALRSNMSSNKNNENISNNNAPEIPTSTEKLSFDNSSSEENNHNSSEAKKYLNQSGDELYSQGLQSLADKNYSTAVEELGSALERLVKKYNQIHSSDTGMYIELAPVYKDYAIALFKNYQANSSVLGQLLNQKQNEQINAGEEPILTNDDEEESGEHEDENNQSGGIQSSAGNAEEGEDNDDLSVSFENLEVARIIYHKSYNDGKCTAEQKHSYGLRVAEIHELLAEISEESENFERAYADYSDALNVYTVELPATHRSLAGLHMDLANVSFFKQDQDVAKGLLHYSAAQRILQNKIIQIYNSLTAQNSNNNKSTLVELAKFDFPQPIDNVSIANVKPEDRTIYHNLIAQIYKSLAQLDHNMKQQLFKPLNELEELKELVNELEERIVDVLQQIEQQKQEILNPTNKPEQAAHLPSQNASEAFSIPPLGAFGFSAESNSNSTLSNTKAATDAAEAPVNLVAVKRKSAANNTNKPNNNSNINNNHHANNINKEISEPAVKRQKDSSADQ